MELLHRLAGPARPVPAPMISHGISTYYVGQLLNFKSMVFGVLLNKPQNGHDYEKRW